RRCQAPPARAVAATLASTWPTWFCPPPFSPCIWSHVSWATLVGACFLSCASNTSPPRAQGACPGEPHASTRAAPCASTDHPHRRNEPSEPDCRRGDRRVTLLTLVIRGLG